MAVGYTGWICGGIPNGRRPRDQGPNDCGSKDLRDPAVAKKFADLGADAKPSTPEALAVMLEQEDKPSCR